MFLNIYHTSPVRYYILSIAISAYIESFNGFIHMEHISFYILFEFFQISFMKLHLVYYLVTYVLICYFISVINIEVNILMFSLEILISNEKNANLFTLRCIFSVNSTGITYFEYQFVLNIKKEDYAFVMELNYRIHHVRGIKIFKNSVDSCKNG